MDFCFFLTTDFRFQELFEVLNCIHIMNNIELILKIKKQDVLKLKTLKPDLMNKIAHVQRIAKALSMLFDGRRKREEEGVLIVKGEGGVY